MIVDVVINKESQVIDIKKGFGRIALTVSELEAIYDSVTIKLSERRNNVVVHTTKEF